jgi:hypothetical protein
MIFLGRRNGKDTTILDVWSANRTEGEPLCLAARFPTLSFTAPRIRGRKYNTLRHSAQSFTNLISRERTVDVL